MAAIDGLKWEVSPEALASQWQLGVLYNGFGLKKRTLGFGDLATNVSRELGNDNAERELSDI